MAGKLCPKCGLQTFFQTPTGRKCTKCNYTMTLAVNDAKGGKGTKCANCGKFQVFENKCHNCQAKYT